MFAKSVTHADCVTNKKRQILTVIKKITTVSYRFDKEFITKCKKNPAITV